MSSDYHDDDSETDVDALRRQASLQNELPPAFAEWRREQQADYIANQMTRTGLIERILARLDHEPDRDVSGANQRLRKEELALIYIALGGVEK